MNDFLTKFRNWYLKYTTEITWFVIGICTIAGIESLARGRYIDAAINFGIVYLNFALNKR